MWAKIEYINHKTERMPYFIYTYTHTVCLFKEKANTTSLKDVVIESEIHISVGDLNKTLQSYQSPSKPLHKSMAHQWYNDLN